MNEPKKVIETLAEFLEHTSALNIQQSEISPFTVPDWESRVKIQLEAYILPVRPCMIPYFSDSKMIKLRQGHAVLGFLIQTNGELGVIIKECESKRKLIKGFRREMRQNKPGWWLTSLGHAWMQDRLSTTYLYGYKYQGNPPPNIIIAMMLYMWKQFEKEAAEVLLLRLKELETSMEIHNSVILEARKTFEPLIPYIIAQELSK